MTGRGRAPLGWRGDRRLGYSSAVARPAPGWLASQHTVFPSTMERFRGFRLRRLRQGTGLRQQDFPLTPPHPAPLEPEHSGGARCRWRHAEALARLHILHQGRESHPLRVTPGTGQAALIGSMPRRPGRSMLRPVAGPRRAAGVAPERHPDLILPQTSDPAPLRPDPNQAALAAWPRHGLPLTTSTSHDWPSNTHPTGGPAGPFPKMKTRIPRPSPCHWSPPPWTRTDCAPRRTNWAPQTPLTRTGGRNRTHSRQPRAGVRWSGVTDNSTVNLPCPSCMTWKKTTG